MEVTKYVEQTKQRSLRGENSMSHKLPIGLTRKTFKLGAVYVYQKGVSCYTATGYTYLPTLIRYRFIKVTQKSFNLLNLYTQECVLKSARVGKLMGKNEYEITIDKVFAANLREE